MKNKIRGIFFDLGGVLVEIDAYFKDLLRHERKLFRIPFKKMERAFHAEEKKIEKNQESSVEYWRRIAKRLRFPPIEDKVARTLLSRSFKKYGSIDARALAIAKKLLRSKRYRLGVISNTTNDHVAIMKKWKLFEYFDPVILSNEVGARKPERKIFMLASRHMGIPSRNLLFIDDNPKWLRAARKCGFKTILFQSPMQLKKQLKRLRLLD